MTDRVYPTEKNLGKNCEFWQGVNIDPSKQMGAMAVGCFFPKVEMEGRLSCEGIIDDVCLRLKDGRPARSLTEEQIIELRHRIPNRNNRDLPPGDVE